ncbi:hypothetical protein AGOR_G00233890 [Albula goreensis]|uniref:Uncharacterized protein n=1 Tax=Albula goreensis TaxID=1534307 RepID=A0A8T3CKN3_9TELE|nr:hypothetical protein AGOR_G00233890 [Albula goreensis]
MNSDLLGGSRRRRPGGSARGNAAAARAPHEAGEEGEEEEQMDRVLEEDRQQRPGAEDAWPAREAGSSNGPETEAAAGAAAGESEASTENGPRKGAAWAWQAEQREEAEDGEENNNSDRRLDDEHQDREEEEDEEEEEGGEDEEDEEEEEMDQDSDDFEHSEDSGREEDGEGGRRLHSPSLRNSASDPNDNMEVSLEQHPRTPSSLFKTKGPGSGEQLFLGQPRVTSAGRLECVFCAEQRVSGPPIEAATQTRRPMRSTPLVCVGEQQMQLQGALPHSCRERRGKHNAEVAPLPASPSEHGPGAQERHSIDLFLLFLWVYLSVSGSYDQTQ